MGNFNKYNDRSLSQLLAESAAILDEEFPPGGATTESPPADTGDLPPDEGAIDSGPPGEEGGEGGAEDTPEGILNQIRDLLDQLASKVGVGGSEEEGGGENVGSTEGGSSADISAPATPPPPMESRKKAVAPAKKSVAPAKKLASSGTKK
jgi:hypothetical protein